MSTVPSTTPITWQSRLVHLLVRARMRPHADAPIDPSWVRRAMGQPRMARRWMARATGVAIERRTAGEGWPGGEVVSWPGYAPDAPVLLYLHGGGYIACSPETHRPLVASLACRIRGRAFVPRYRLAPEYPFPAALDDAMAAYRYLLDVERVAPAQIVIAGDSAGGGLALALALAIRDAAWPSPAGLVTFCPWTDLAATGESLDENTERCAMFAGDTIRRAARFYVGDADPMLPSISPLYGDFHGLPPMLVHAREDEVLRDDAIRVAEVARRAGVDVELQLWPHVPHVWQFFAAVLPEARASLAAATRFIRARTTHD
jgi:acetyl esterase/lipase